MSEIIYEDDPEAFDKLREWEEEAVTRFESEYGEIDTDESWSSDSEDGVFYATTKDGRRFRLYFAERNRHLKCYRKCFVVSVLEVVRER